MSVMTLEQAIEHAEEVALEQIRLMGRYDAASGYARSGNEAIRTESAKECEKCAAEHKQLAAWLRELVECRKAPEIIFCKDCEKHNKRFDEYPADEACPLSVWRVAQGHEFDYQFCVYGKRAERKTDD